MALELGTTSGMSQMLVSHLFHGLITSLRSRVKPISPLTHLQDLKDGPLGRTKQSPVSPVETF